MIFETRLPARPLAGFVARYWYYEGLDVPYERERVFPDGSSHLMVNLGDEPRRVFDRDEGERVADYRRAWVSGVHTRYLVIDARRGSSLLGAQFRPGGLTPFLPVPPGELLDRVVELEELLGLIVRDLRDALIEAPTPGAKFRVLEEFLLRRARRGLPRSPAVAHALERFQRTPHMGTVDAVARGLGMSHKQFIARFRAEVGLTPKRFCRIRRFQRVITSIGRRTAVDWPDLACACGYFDQAHFIGEFREFSGLSPTAYLRQRGEDLNHVPLTVER